MLYCSHIFFFVLNVPGFSSFHSLNSLSCSTTDSCEWLYHHRLTIVPAVVIDFIQNWKWRKSWWSEETRWRERHAPLSCHSLKHTNFIHTHTVLPSRAYFMSWANSAHMTSALTLPTLSSWGNLKGGGRVQGSETNRECVSFSVY